MARAESHCLRKSTMTMSHTKKTEKWCLKNTFAPSPRPNSLSTPVRLPWRWKLMGTPCTIPSGPVAYLRPSPFLSVSTFVPHHPRPKRTLFLWCKTMCSQPAFTESISGLLIGFSRRFGDYRQDTLSTRVFGHLRFHLSLPSEPCSFSRLGMVKPCPFHKKDQLWICPWKMTSKPLE